MLLEAEGIVEPSPRAERTRSKPTQPHSALDRLLQRFAALGAGTAYADEPRPEVEAQVRDLLERYRAALQTKNVDEVAALYVSFSERQRDALRGYLANAKDLTVELADIASRRTARTWPCRSPATTASSMPRVVAPCASRCV